MVINGVSWFNLYFSIFRYVLLAEEARGPRWNYHLNKYVFFADVITWVNWLYHLYLTWP